MLRIFTRHVDESLVIGEGIEVTVLEIGDGFVRLAFRDTTDTLPSYWEETLSCQTAACESEFELQEI